MKKKLVTCVFLTLVFLTGVSAVGTYSNQNSVKLYHGEKLRLDNYTFEYSSYDYKDGEYFQINQDKEKSNLVLKNVDKLYESEGEIFDIPQHNMSVELTYIGRDDNGRYLNLTISSDQNIFASADLTDSAPDTVIVSQGGSVEVPLKLRNTGLVKQSLTFSGVENTSMETTFSYQDFNITSVDVDPGEEISATARIQIPENMPTGNYDVKLLAAGETNASKTLNIEVRGKSVQRRREIDMNIREMYIQANPGETLRIPVELRNRGNAPLNNLKLETTTPDGWSETVRPKKVNLRERYEDRTITAELTVPQSIESGDYFFEVSANSDEAETQPREVRIHIQKKSGLSYVGIGLMALSLLGLIIVYRKFGRR